MKITELYEGAEPKLPGAVSGIKIMTPQQFAGEADDDQEGMAEAGFPGAPDVEMPPMNPSGDPQRDKLKQEYMDLHREIKSLVDLQYRSTSDEQKMQAKARIEQLNDRADQIKAILEPRQPPNEWQKKTYGFDDNWNKVNQGVAEATALPAQSRELGGQEFQDYMGRIKGTDDIDKRTGQIKLDKKGNEKYVTGKTKTDKYKMPYMHRSSVIEYYDEAGKRFKEEAVVEALKQRPKKLLKQNEKMKHSNGEFEQFFNVGFAALTGVAVDEATDKLIIVNTCPGAGSCKVDCFAMKGGKIQFKAAWLSDGRILTYLLNDPNGFFSQLSSEIASEEAAASKGDKKFPNGWQVTVRWHDAGDFFSPEYLELALNMAAKHPNVKFYAYTKMAAAALAKKPDNFIINWSEGANTTQEKQVKQQDPNLDTTKNSRIVPEKLFYDLLAKDAKGNLNKTADGAWQPASPEALAQMKQRIAQAYKISANSILSYAEYNDKVVSKQWKEWLKTNGISIEELRMYPDYEAQLEMYKKRFMIDKYNGKVQQVTPLKYNVIVAPGEGDISANDPSVLSTLLLRH